MKKKGFIVLLLLAAMILSIALSGCTLVKLNEERQAQRVIATVSYTVKPNDTAKKVLNELGITDYNISIDITRRELISSTNYRINRMASTYSAYSLTYNYDYETEMADTLESLISTKYQVAKAVEELLNCRTEEQLKTMYMYCEKDAYQDVYGKKLSAEGVLTMSEWYSAIGAINDSMDTLLESYKDSEDGDARNDRISSADNKISDFYQEGYFVTAVYVIKSAELEDGEVASKPYTDQGKDGLLIYTENGEKYVSGLYQDNFVLSGTASSDDSSSSDPESTELDYTKVYVAIEMKKGESTVYVPRPAVSSGIDISRVSDAKFVANNIRTRSVTVSYTGRKSAKITESNDTGYTNEEFTSEPLEYNVAFARNALKESEEKVEYLKEEIELDESKTFSFRYASKKDWDDFIAIYNKDAEEGKEIDKENAKYNAVYDEKGIYKGFIELYNLPLSTQYAGNDKIEKDAYRQLRNTLSSANIGYVEKEPEDKNSAEYKYFKYYKGLYIYYNEQFMSVVMDAVEYELGKNLTVGNDDILASYIAKVKQDKVKYDALGYEEQRNTFFSDTDCIDEVYYVPMEALKETYVISKDDKSYAPLFKEDGTPKDGLMEAGYIVMDGDDYAMPYIVDNKDGTYTINAFFVGAMLFSFGNDERINDAVVVSSGKVESIDGYKDLPIDKQVEYLNKLAKMMDTVGQVETSFDALQEDITTIDELYDVKDKKAVTEILAEIAGLEGTREEIIEAFDEYMKKFNDDGGAMKDPGYLITSGDISDSWAMEDFADSARNLYYSMIAAGVDPNAATNDLFVEGMTYYGLHYMMVTLAPYYRVTLGTVTIDGETCYFIAPTTTLNLKGETQNSVLGDSLLDTKKSKTYSDWKASFTDEQIEKATVRNEKNYKNLVKEIKDKNK